MNKLFVASISTLATLLAFVFGLIILAMQYTGQIDLGVAAILTVVVNFILWFVSPIVSDFINRIFYKVRFLSEQELTAEHKEVFDIIKEVSTQYKFRFPKVGIIPDNNPTAFTYGSWRSNSRIILTQGIFHFLNPQEIRAVVAHELGHIVRRDFIIMMIATTLIQILYEIYANFSKTKDKKGDALKFLSIVAYVLYVIGVYLMYYLSRTREYLADQFSTQYSRPEDLSNALIKIAYGIVTVEDDNNSKKLLESTRHLGIIDVRKAKYYGVASLVSDSNPDLISEVMVFDKVSPWAFFIELGSTHPLTGKRIQHLKEIANQRGDSFPYDIDRAQNRMNIDKSRLYREFIVGSFFVVIPIAIPLISIFTLPLVYIPAAFGISFLIRLIYRYPLGKNENTTIIDEMRNPYASPLRGKNISLTGRVIGRGIPGYIFGEDMMYQDKTGIIFLNFNSIFGFIGNLFFSLKKLKTLIGVPSEVTGWFYRGMGSMIELKRLKTSDRTINSHPIFWSFLSSMALIALSVLLYTYLGIYTV